MSAVLCISNTVPRNSINAADNEARARSGDTQKQHSINGTILLYFFALIIVFVIYIAVIISLPIIYDISITANESETSNIYVPYSPIKRPNYSVYDRMVALCIENYRPYPYLVNLCVRGIDV